MHTFLLIKYLTYKHCYSLVSEQHFYEFLTPDWLSAERSQIWTVTYCKKGHPVHDITRLTSIPYKTREKQAHTVNGYDDYQCHVSVVLYVKASALSTQLRPLPPSYQGGGGRKKANFLNPFDLQPAILLHTVRLRYWLGFPLCIFSSYTKLKTDLIH